MITHDDNVHYILLTPRAVQVKEFTFQLMAAESRTIVVLLAGVSGSYTFNIQVQGEAASAKLVLMPLLWKKQNVAITILQEHHASKTKSAVLLYGALAGSARVMSRCKTMIKSGLENVAATQQSSFLLLSKSARVQVTPALLTNSKEIVCSHGAAVGSFDPNHCVYLALRGVDEVVARRLLLEGYLLQSFGKGSFDCVDKQLHKDIETAIAHML